MTAFVIALSCDSAAAAAAVAAGDFSLDRLGAVACFLAVWTVVVAAAAAAAAAVDQSCLMAISDVVVGL